MRDAERRACLAGLLGLTLAGCTRQARTAAPCSAAWIPKRTQRDTTCRDVAGSYRTDVGCSLDPSGTTLITFQNHVKPYVRVDRLLFMINKELVFDSMDPLVLERGVFPLATLPAQDHEVMILVRTSGRGEPLCGYRHELRSSHTRKAAKGRLAIVLYATDNDPMHEAIHIRYDDWTARAK
jgi:hypothetical protein